MITIKKISTLKPRVQIRKLGGIFHEAFVKPSDEAYVNSAYEYLINGTLISEEDKVNISCLYTSKSSLAYEDIYYYLLNILGESPADWDMVDEGGNIDWSKRMVKEHYLYLDHLRSPYNVGSIFRSSESFGVQKIYLSSGCASPEHPRSRRTSRDTVDGVLWGEMDLSDIDMPIFALELGGKDLSEFEFPKCGICIIGSEESGVSKEALAYADASLGRVSIKQYGAKGSINVSAATAILLNRWMEYSAKKSPSM